MDGIKRRVKGSLQYRLSLSLLLAILSVALIAGIISFFSAFNEANELQDGVLRQVASLFDRHNIAVPKEGDSGRNSDGDAESRVFVQLLSTTSPIHTGTDTKPPLALPQNIPDGIQTLGVGNKTYRILVSPLSTGQRLAVAQETAIRDEIARDGALRTLTPFLILVPILLIVVAKLVGKIFKPVADLALEIDQRDEQELHPIASEPLPAEIRPFVGAINRLLGRVEQSMEAQRRFVADAAHELRSPLTALSLQAERLADSEMSVNAHTRLDTLRRGIERGRALLDQLLALARAQASTVSSSTSVSVQQVYRRVLEDMMPLAEVKRIDIGVVSELDAHVFANEIDLITLVKNLVDNAIRYTPSGGRVDLSVMLDNDVTVLMVEDNGPGIPESERDRVFDPFHRILGSNEMGSGLGLSIVQTIASRTHAKVSLGFSNDQMRSGLRVVVTFPFVRS
ncbi:ATP-binding protein [Aeromonas sp. EERV15]|uniref:ATP-binding protein n=1 Tax=Aeromonas sp. EERV15 TaxID=1833892 RepID=UPI00083B1AB3|nr:ATP-binding protein [Aeromonas sp. EERV15]